MSSSIRLRLLAPSLGCLVVLAASSVAALQETATDESLSARMAVRANAFLAKVDAARATLAKTEHGDGERTQWAFGPVQREGVPLTGLNEEQMGALEGLLDTALSDAGMRTWREVRALEVELRRLESTPERVAENRNPDLYWLRVYGTPGAEQRWSWRFEGHHLALHVDCRPEKTPSVTPFFVGASPLFVDGEGGEERVGVQLFGALNESYRALCGALGADAGTTEQPRPTDIRMGPGQDALPPVDGVAFGDLAVEDRVKAISLLDGYLALLEPELRRPYLIDAERASKVHFVRWGGADIRGPRAWGLLAPRFALELVTTNVPEHVHIVLRDPERDFGGK